VTASILWLVPVLVAVTVTPGTGAPDWSATVPTMAPYSACVYAGGVAMTAAIKAIAATIAAFREMRMRSVITEISFLTW
jgi:hypothetical protein